MSHIQFLISIDWVCQGKGKLEAVEISLIGRLKYICFIRKQRDKKKIHIMYSHTCILQLCLNHFCIFRLHIHSSHQTTGFFSHPFFFCTSFWLKISVFFSFLQFVFMLPQNQLKQQNKVKVHRQNQVYFQLSLWGCSCCQLVSGDQACHCRWISSEGAERFNLRFHWKLDSSFHSYQHTWFVFWAAACMNQLSISVFLPPHP